MGTPKVSKVQQRVLDRKNAESLEQYKDQQEQKKQQQAVDDLLDALKDTKIPENKFWDEAENSYQIAKQATIAASVDFAQALIDYKNDPQRFSTCKNPDRLAVLITQVGIDTKQYLDQLEEIHAKHEQHSGGTKSPDEHVACLQINESYRTVMDLFHTNVNPMVMEIHEMIGTIDQAIANAEECRRLEAQQALAQAQDPSVVTDVQVKS